MGAAQSQPSGRALPCTIPPGARSRDEHLALAMKVNPFTQLLEEALTPHTKLNAIRCAREPALMIARRSRAFSKLCANATRLEPLRKRQAETLPQGSPAKNLHLPLFQFAISSLGYPDTALAHDLSYGMPIAGNIPPTNVLIKRESPAQTEHSVWLKTIPARNKENVERVLKTQGTPPSLECWERTLDEVKKGWVSTPSTITTEDMATLPLTPRSPKTEQHGANNPKTRLLDDFRASGINELAATQDTDVPDTLDAALSIASLYEKLKPGIQLNVCAVDFRHAYKNIPIAADQQNLATIALAPPVGPAMKATLKTQPFGAARAPANWARVAAFLRWICARMFGIAVYVYVDDCFLVEPTTTIGSAFRTFKNVCDLFGLPLEDSKEKTPSAGTELLGANIQFSPGHVQASLPPKKASTYQDELRKILSNNTLSPGDAAKIRGKLGFAQTLMFGRSGRAMLQPFSARQYDPTATSRANLSIDLKESIPWWIGQLSRTRPRMVSTKYTMPVLVYTDACGAGHLGAVVVVDGTQHTHHTRIPPWLERSTAGISEYELVACLLGLILAALYAPGRPVLLCCDNMGARGAVVRGSCATPIGRMLSAAFWNVAAMFSCAVWVEFVASALNVADPPSRACELIPLEERHNGTSEGMPALFEHIMSSRHALATAQFNVNTHQCKIIKGWSCPARHSDTIPAKAN